jgi:hypothetical protein
MTSEAAYLLLREKFCLNDDDALYVLRNARTWGRHEQEGVIVTCEQTHAGSLFYTVTDTLEAGSPLPADTTPPPRSRT